MSLWVRIRRLSSTSDTEAERCKKPEGKFLMVIESARQDVLLELVLTGEEELVKDVKV